MELELVGAIEIGNLPPVYRSSWASDDTETVADEKIAFLTATSDRR
jgi:hypothetical protein